MLFPFYQDALYNAKRMRFIPSSEVRLDMKQAIFKVSLVLFLLVFLCGCAGAKSGNSLQLEDHALRGAPQVIPLTFEPVDSTQAEIFAVHATERAAKITYEITAPEGNPVLESQGEPKDLKAVVLTATSGQPLQTVRLLGGAEVIFETPGGLPSPAVPVQASTQMKPPGWAGFSSMG